MHRFLIHILSLFLIVPSLFAEGVTQYVNPLMGTTTLWTPEELGFVPKPGERQWGAETFPGAALPNAMVQLTPVTQYRSGSGYQYEDSLIYGFAHTSKGHWNLLHLPILPVTEEGKPTPQSYASAYHHDREEAHPGYYQVFLDRYNVNAELTTTLRCGYHRYTFRESDHKALLIDIARSNNMPRRWELKQAGTNAIEGFQDGEGRIYFYAVSNLPVSSVQIERDTKHQVALVDFRDNVGSDPLEVKFGFSFVSIENARQNLEAEMLQKSFQQVRQEADQTWERLLNHIQVEGGTQRQRGLLYSTLYRCFLWPALRSDTNGQYLDVRGQVVQGDFRYYTDPSFWDTYRNKLILLGLLSPQS